MSNLAWAPAMQVLQKQTEQLSETWEAVEFRFLLGESDGDSSRVEGAYFELTFEPLPGELRVALDAPLLLQGRMSVVQFVSLLKRWFDGQHFAFGGYKLTPPEIASLSWDQDIPAAHLFDRPINPLPPTDTEYRFHRLTGG